MLRVCRFAVVVIGALLVQASLAGPVAGQVQSGTGDVLRTLTGFWKAPEYKVSVSSDLDFQVWGRGASKVRNVELALEPTGEGVLRVRTAVVDARGRTKPYSASVIEAKLQVQPSDASSEGRIEPRVKVVSAEERYLDGSGDRRPIEGLTVTLNMLSPTSRELNIRFDTPQGMGSFGETLVRSAKPATVAVAKAPSSTRS